MKIPLSDSVLDEVHGLALACLSGEASQTDVDRLGALLLESEAARRVYVDAIRDSFGLRRWAAAEKLHAGDLFDVGGSDAEFLRLAVSDAESADWIAVRGCEKMGTGSEPIRANPVETASGEVPVPIFSQPLTPSRGIPGDEPRGVGSDAPAPLLAFLAGGCRNAAGYLSGHEFVMSYLVATVVFAIVTLASCYLPAPYQSAVRREADGLAKAEPAPASKTLIPRQETVLVGRITGAADCRWADPQVAPPGAAVPVGCKYALASGLVEITYDTGARVILQGPCTYEVDSARSGFLSLGKLTARVETKGEGGRGKAEENDVGAAVELPHQHGGAQNSPFPLPPSAFTVRTPAATVTDLGTAFGVEVTREGYTEAHVFQGVIRVTSAAGGAGSAPHERVCREGEAVHVGAGDTVVHPIAPERNTAALGFVRVMPLPQSVRDSQAYAELVLSLNPAAYYRMERPSSENDRYRVVDSAPGGWNGELRLGGDDRWLYMSGRFGDALYFRGPESDDRLGDRVIVPDYPKAAGDRLTVAAWVIAVGRPEWAMIASNWGIPDREHENTGQFQLCLYRDDGDLAACVTQRDGQRVEVREGRDSPLPLRVWQHVALVADGTALRLYRNGKEVASGPCAGVLPHPPLAGLGIGCRTNKAGTDGHVDRTYCWYWRGGIDELAIFNQALSPQNIEQLYLGKPNVVGTLRVPSTNVVGTLRVPSTTSGTAAATNVDGTRSVPNTAKRR